MYDLILKIIIMCIRSQNIITLIYLWGTYVLDMNDIQLKKKFTFYVHYVPT